MGRRPGDLVVLLTRGKPIIGDGSPEPIAGFDLLLVPAGAEARMGGLAYHSRARVAGPSEGRVFPAVDAWRHFCEIHVFFLPICLDQPTDVGEDATTDAEVRP